MTVEFKVEFRQLCAELKQTLWTEIGLEVERKVSEKVAPLQEELAAMKVEVQHLKKRMEYSPPSTSQQLTQPDVSKLEDKIHKLEQARQIASVCTRSLQTKWPTAFVCKDRMQTDAVVTKATRFENKGAGDVSPGLVIVEFASLADKRKVLKARIQLAGCHIGLDDDLTATEAEVCCVGQVHFATQKSTDL